MMVYFLQQKKQRKYTAVLPADKESRKKTNVELYHDITEVEKAGFRACKRCQPEVEQSPHIEVVRIVITFLINRYKQNLMLKDIADHVGLSPFYLERLFKQETFETLAYLFRQNTHR